MAHLTHTTIAAKPRTLKRSWHVINANGKVLGRLATVVAEHLTGKNKPTYSPEADCGDFVIVLNSRNIVTTGKKDDQKEYTRYSGYPGGLKKVTLGQAKLQKPNFVIHKAIWGMLPKNKLRKLRIRRLYIYESDTHPHQKEVKSVA